MVYYIDKFVELVCMNFLWVNGLMNVVGVIKEEMWIFDFIIIEVVDKVFVLVGGVFVVDWYEFFGYIIDKVKNYLFVIVYMEEVIIILEGLIIIVIGLFISFVFVDEIK